MNLLLLILAAASVLVPTPFVDGDAIAASSRPSFRLFVTNYRDDTVSVINGDTRSEEKVLEVGATPQGLAHRAEPPLVAVANSTGRDVTLVDPLSLEVLGRIPTGGEPEDVEFSRDGKTLYATSAETKAVHVLDVEKRQEIARLPSAKLGRPVRLLVSPDGAFLYVLIRSKQGQVWIFDTESNERVATISIGVNSNDFALSTDGNTLVTSSFAEDRLSVIDTKSRTVSATHDASTGAGLLMHPSKSRVYSLASFEDEVIAVDYETGAKLGTATSGGSPQYGAISPNGATLFVAYEDSNRIVAIDTETMKQAWRAGAGEEPADVEYVPLPGAPYDDTEDTTRGQ